MSIRPVVFTLLVVAVLQAAGPGLRAQTAAEVEILAVHQLSPSERVGTLRTAAPRTTSGPVSAEAPPLPPGFEAETEDRLLSTPVRDDGLAIPPAQAVETVSGALPQPQAPGTFVIVRDTVLTPPITSRVNEPNVGSQGQGIFTTHNWYAEISTNNGGTFSYINPFTLFPASPAAFGAGFCCDQRVAQDSSRNLIFWYMQYIKTGTSPTSTNGVRLAVTHGQAGLAANSWQSYDFTPAQFGLSGKWFDYPNLQASANDLYFTTNIFASTNDAFYGALVVRMPLAQLDAGSPLTFDYYLTTSLGSILAVNGAAAEGTRPGRTTMYFGAVASSNSLQVLTWPEANPAPTVTTVAGLATTAFATYTCVGPDSLDPCSRADFRPQAGWITNSQLGFMWTSAQNGASRPYPYVRTAILDPGTLAVLSQPDIFSITSAWLYPAVAVNERGDLGGVVDNLGGNVLPTIRALIRDGFSADPSVSGWETYSVATSTSGTSGLWGDYNGAMAHEQLPTTWLGVGHAQSGGSGDVSSRPHNFWFGRQADIFSSAVDFYSVTPCRVVDTRITGGPLVSGVPRAIPVGGVCGVPADAVAVSINVTVVSPTGGGFVVLYPGDAANPPPTSTVNFAAGQVRANNAVLPLAGNGAGTLAGQSAVAGLGQVDLVVDVNGYFK